MENKEINDFFINKGSTVKMLYTSNSKEGRIIKKKIKKNSNYTPPKKRKK